MFDPFIIFGSFTSLDRVRSGFEFFVIHTLTKGQIKSKNTVGGIAHICFRWFQITADAHPGVSWVSNDQKFCEKFKTAYCQADHPAKIE